MNLENKPSDLISNENSEINLIEEIRENLEKHLTPQIFKDLYKIVDENVKRKFFKFLNFS